jgi:hypothetical protein
MPGQDAAVVFRARVQLHITGQLGRTQNNNDDEDEDEDDDGKDDDDNDDVDVGHGDDHNDDNNKRTSQGLEAQSYGGATSLIICHVTHNHNLFFNVMFE